MLLTLSNGSAGGKMNSTFSFCGNFLNWIEKSFFRPTQVGSEKVMKWETYRCDLGRTCKNSMLLDPCPHLALVVNQIGTRLRANPRLVLLYISVHLCRSVIMRSLPVTAWCGAGLSLVAGVAIGLLSCWAGKDWWNAITRPFPIPENLDRKWTSHCLVKFPSLFVSASLFLENGPPMILQILP